VSRTNLITSTVALAASLSSPAAIAHNFEHPKIVEIGLHKNELALSIKYDLNPGNEARLVRALFDRNTDGHLDGTEQAKLVRYLERTAMLFIDLQIQSAQAKLIRQSGSAHRVALPVEATQTMGVSVLYIAPLPKVAPGELLTIQIKDRDKDPAKHVPVTLGYSEGWEVAFASQGELHPAPRQIHRIKLDKHGTFELRVRHGSRLGARNR